MKTIKVNLYKFSELSEDAKQKAMDHLYDINASYDCLESVYEDAAQIGLKITGFDIGRGNYCDGEWRTSAEEAAQAIIQEHGDMCETYKSAEAYLRDRDNLVFKYSDKVNTEIVAEDNEAEFDADCDELDAEFLNSLLQDYLVMLRNEYEYFTSEEAIIKIIEANDYAFTEDGKLY